MGLTAEAKESTESGEVGTPPRALQILCTTSVQDCLFRDVVSLPRLCPEADEFLATAGKCRLRRRENRARFGTQSVFICVHLWLRRVWLRPPRPRCVLCGSISDLGSWCGAIWRPH
jgi:hypothetical protein